MAPHLLRLPGVPEYRWAVGIQPVQQPPKVLKHLYSLNALRLVLPYEAEVRLQSLVRNIHIPSPPPHMIVLVTSLRTLMFDEPPCCHVHSSQVTVEQRLHSLLNQSHIGPIIVVELIQFFVSKEFVSMAVCIRLSFGCMHWPYVCMM